MYRRKVESMHSHRLLPLLIAAMSLIACGSPAGGGAPAAPLAAGERLFNNNCSACHQKDGKGLGNNAQPSLVNAPVVAGPVDEMAGWVLYAKRPAALPKGKYVAVMPQFAWLSDEDAAALLTYVRTHFGNDYGPVTVDDIRRVRASRQ
jgi:mono/diheme cytochrome c family protein